MSRVLLLGTVMGDSVTTIGFLSSRRYGHLYGKCVSELVFGNIYLSRVVLLGAATDDGVRTR